MRLLRARIAAEIAQRPARKGTTDEVRGKLAVQMRRTPWRRDAAGNLTHTVWGVERVLEYSQQR